jgi:hypothetical protein
LVTLSGPRNREKGETKRKGVTERKANLQNKERKKKLKSTAYAFSFVACNDGPHSRQGREEKKKAGQIHLFPGVTCGGA